jgi:uncharacterized membrane protein YbhN (UPF0104 family)
MMQEAVTFDPPELTSAQAPAAIPPQKPKRPLMRVLRIVVSVALLGWVLYAAATHQGAEVLAERLREVRPSWLIMSGVWPCVAVMFGVLRWRVLLREEGLRLALPWLARHFLIGRFVGAFTPSTTGLDGYRTLAVSRYTGETVAASRALVLEKVVGLVGLAAVTALCAGLGVTGVSGNAVWLGILVSLGFAAGGYWVVRRPARVVALLPAIGPLKRVRKLLTDISGSHARSSALLLAILLGLLSHAATAAIFVASAWAVHVDLPAAVLFGVGNAIVIATLLPLSAGGVGVREGAAVLLLGALHVDSGTALLVAVVGYLGGQVPAVLGGVLSAVSGEDARSQR